MKHATAAFEEDQAPARITSLALTEITCDPAILPREINFAVVKEYREDLDAGAEFPPVEVVHDGDTFLLVDGLQRFEAARLNRLKTIRCAVRKGDRRAAILASAGANATHGQRRTNAEKRRAVLKLLTDPKWSRWADREIARRCHVSPMLVATMRAELVAERLTISSYGEEPREVRLYIDKHGTKASMNVTHIRRSEPLTPLEIKEALKRQRRSYFRETIDQLRNFKERGIYEVEASEIIQVLVNINTRDGLARVSDAVEFIRAALNKARPLQRELDTAKEDDTAVDAHPRTLQ
jgi:hypothetical protein